MKPPFHDAYSKIKWFIPILGLIISIIWLLIHRRNQKYSIFRCDQAKEIERELKLDNDQLLFIMGSMTDIVEKRIKDIKQKDLDKWIAAQKENIKFERISFSSIKKIIFSKPFFSRFPANNLIFALYWIFVFI